MFPVHAIQLSDTEALGTAARLGMGLCQLPDYVVHDDLVSGELVELLPGFQPEPMPINAVVPSGRLVPPRVRVALAALDSLRERRVL
jgi:DNA-binding transcriptional LysR family regulator